MAGLTVKLHWLYLYQHGAQLPSLTGQETWGAQTNKMKHSEEILLRYLLKESEIIPMLRAKPWFSCFTEQRPDFLGRKYWEDLELGAFHISCMQHCAGVRASTLLTSALSPLVLRAPAPDPWNCPAPGLWGGGNALPRGVLQFGKFRPPSSKLFIESGGLIITWNDPFGSYPLPIFDKRRKWKNYINWS